MTFPKVRAVVAAILLACWILYLGYLVYETRDVVVLSKPQFMLAHLYVVINVRDKDGKADPDVEVVSATSPQGEVLIEPRLHLPDISACAKAQGYHGPGKYLVPLIHSPNGYLIAPVPRVDSYNRQAMSHGSVEASGIFSQRVRRRLPLLEARQLSADWEKEGYKVSLTEEEIRIYLWTPETAAQLKPFTEAKK